jgi:phage head maturation protease
MQKKSCDIALKDVNTEKGIVEGYFSAFGNVDSDGDMSTKRGVY